MTKNHKTKGNYKTGGCHKFDCLYFGTSYCDTICFRQRMYISRAAVYKTLEQKRLNEGGEKE